MKEIKGKYYEVNLPIALVTLVFIVLIVIGAGWLLSRIF